MRVRRDGRRTVTLAPSAAFLRSSRPWQHRTASRRPDCPNTAETERAMTETAIADHEIIGDLQTAVQWAARASAE